MRRLLVGSGARDACPDADRIWELCRGALASEATDAILRHAVDCRDCREALEAGRRAVAGAAQDRPRRRGARFVLAAAAVLVLAIAAGLVADRLTPTPTRRGDATQRSWVDLGEGRALPREAFELRWGALADGASYQVELRSIELDLLERSAWKTSTRYRVRPELIEGREVLLWRVRARRPNGTIEESPVFRTPVAR